MIHDRNRPPGCESDSLYHRFELEPQNLFAERTFMSGLDDDSTQKNHLKAARNLKSMECLQNDRRCLLRIPCTGWPMKRHILLYRKPRNVYCRAEEFCGQTVQTINDVNVDDQNDHFSRAQASLLRTLTKTSKNVRDLSSTSSFIAEENMSTPRRRLQTYDIQLLLQNYCEKSKDFPLKKILLEGLLK